MDEYGINLTGDLSVDADDTYDMGSPSKRIRTVYTGTIDATSSDAWPKQASAPTGVDAEPGDAWFDTANKLLRIRNDGDTEWLGVMYGNTSTKMYVYANTAGDGWAIDGAVTDVLLSLKGGATYLTGGAQFGNFDPGNHTHTGPSHTHTGPSHTHSIATTTHPHWSGSVTAQPTHISTGTTGADGTGATGADGTGLTGAGGSNAAYRPAAAVGTLQNLDV